ncbi:MAG: hypothetical protein M1570_18575 [Chloroflexi bacterium]|nr:hypothetical protein [Chloroflexota bacterium]
MRPNTRVRCKALPCSDVKHECYLVPDINLKTETISIVMVSEAAPTNPKDYFYAKEDSLFQQTTVQAFNDAGAKASSVRDLLGLGVYLTTAVKCGKTGYGLQASTVKECSLLLEQELAFSQMCKSLCSWAMSPSRRSTLSPSGRVKDA